jgi:tripartite-type tricarboxylate transporter receptor subunit TctC
LSGPKGISDAAAKGLHDAIKVALDSPEYKKIYTKQGLVPVLMNRAESRKFVGEFVTEVTVDLKELGVLK